MIYRVRVLRMDGTRMTDGFFETDVEADNFKNTDGLIYFYTDDDVIAVFSIHTLFSIVPKRKK